ncbi:MAG: peptide ABC transporter substrate-binding protein [Herpetosiphonaceae bacterium]|nr:MAG: peptide ABC transporter substrate-binding protein [Herpetosiphonaceae bacterium]
MPRRVSMLILLMLVALTGCSGLQAAPTATIPAELLEHASSAGGGGELILALGAELPTLDPAEVTDTTSALVTRQIFSGLVRLTNDLEVEPDLAERWDISPDGRVYTFYLRPEARFADGTPILAEDIRWSLERAMSPGRYAAATYLNDIEGALEKMSGQADSVSGLRVIDDHTIEITLRAPNAVFLLKLTNSPAFVVDRRAVERGGSDWTDEPNGSGPFMLYERNADGLLLRPNLYYYGRPAKLDQLTLLLGAAAASELVLYEQGKVDYAEVPYYALPRVADPSNPLSRELVTVPALSLSYIGMNVNIPPFDDPKVRQAFSLLIDRERLVKSDGLETAVAARGFVPPTMPGANPDLPPPPEPDVEEIKRLLAESRYGGAENLPPIVGYTNGGSVALLGELLKETLGITMEVRTTETWGAYLQGLNEYPMFDLSWIADYPDPENFLEALFGANSGSNHTGYNNPQVEEIFAMARAEQDEQRRYELYQQAEQMILQDAPAIPLYHSVQYALVKPYVKGLVVTPQGLIDLSTVELVP